MRPPGLPGRPPGRWPAVVLALLAADAAVILTFVVSGLGPGSPDAAIFDDGGVGEVLGYAKTVATAVVLVAVAVRARRAVYAAWALLVGVVVLDDALLLHEAWGARLVASVDIPVVPGLRAQDTGELLVWAALGIVPGALVLLIHLRSDPSTRRRSLGIGCLFAALLAVAVVLDPLVVATGPSRTAALLALAEDGGELAVMTLLLGFALLLHAETGARDRAGAPLSRT